MLPVLKMPQKPLNAPETMWYHHGSPDNETIVLLKCPGYEELRAKQPAVGRTGENLSALFRYIREASNGQIMLSKKNVEILNVSKVPHFKTSPYGREVKKNELVENIKFVRMCIWKDGIRRIICCGKYPEAVLSRIISFDDALCKRLDISYVCHLGDQGLLDGKSRYDWPLDTKNIAKRLDYLANEMVKHNFSWKLPRGVGYKEFEVKCDEGEIMGFYNNEADLFEEA